MQLQFTCILITLTMHTTTEKAEDPYNDYHMDHPYDTLSVSTNIIYYLPTLILTIPLLCFLRFHTLLFVF